MFADHSLRLDQLSLWKRALLLLALLLCALLLLLLRSLLLLLLPLRLQLLSLPLLLRLLPLVLRAFLLLLLLRLPLLLLLLLLLQARFPGLVSIVLLMYFPLMCQPRLRTETVSITLTLLM